MTWRARAVNPDLSAPLPCALSLEMHYVVSKCTESNPKVFSTLQVHYGYLGDIAELEPGASWTNVSQLDLQRLTQLLSLLRRPGAAEHRYILHECD